MGNKHGTPQIEAIIKIIYFRREFIIIINTESVILKECIRFVQFSSSNREETAFFKEARGHVIDARCRQLSPARLHILDFTFYNECNRSWLLHSE